jgi:hypothetical protein
LKAKIILASLLVLTIVYACKKDSITTYDCTGVTPTYNADIKTIVDANCATSNCHNASSKADGIDLSTYEFTKLNSTSDKFMKSIQHVGGAESMPRGASKLSEDKIKLIYCWVQNGQPQ